MKPRRQGYKRFMLESGGVARASNEGAIIPVLDKNGIVRIRKRTRSASHESHCVTVNHGLKAFLKNRRWRTNFSKLKAIYKLLKEREGCEIDPQIAAMVKEFVNGLTVEGLKKQLQEVIDSLKDARKFAYAKRLEKDLEEVKDILEKAKALVAEL